MSSSFNLNMFLKEYQTYGDRKYTSFEIGNAKMEERELDNARAALSQSNFLDLTLGEKLTELGVGKKVMHQLGEIAMKPITDIVDSVNDYLKKYEVVLDEKKYFDAMQGDAKQLFFSKNALAKDVIDRIDFGKNFNMFM